MEVVSGICDVILENKHNIIFNDLIQKISESNNELRLLVANDFWDELKVGFKGILIIKYKMINIENGIYSYKLVKHKIKLKDIFSKSSNDFNVPTGTTYVFKKIN